MRTYLQNETAECGMACIAMVASHFRKNQELSDLRKQYNSSLGGSRLSDLISILIVSGKLGEVHYSLKLSPKLSLHT